MTEVLHWGSLYGPLAQNLAAVTETTKLRSPARRRDLFWELIRCQCSAPGSQPFRRTAFPDVSGSPRYSASQHPRPISVGRSESPCGSQCLALWPPGLILFSGLL